MPITFPRYQMTLSHGFAPFSAKFQQKTKKVCSSLANPFLFTLITANRNALFCRQTKLLDQIFLFKENQRLNNQFTAPMAFGITCIWYRIKGGEQSIAT